MTSPLSKILHLCSRISGHDQQRRQLRELSATFTNWQRLLSKAELEGVTPLLHKHLTESECVVPTAICRSLSLLVSRHKRYAELRNIVLHEVLQSFGRENIQVLVLKGAALSHTLYAEPYLRPMRDIDLLLDEENVDTAQAILKQCGYLESQAAIPADHFHLPPLFRPIDNISVCVEIHRGLFPKCSPFYPDFDFPGLLKKSRKFKIDGIQAQTFGDEDMLWYLYEHGFRAPLPYEGYRLINVADLTGMLEEQKMKLDWRDLKFNYPRMCSSLPLMHHFSPWNPEFVNSHLLHHREYKKEMQPKRFKGWPKRKFNTYRREGTGLIRILSETFFPPIWWLKVYYGKTTLFGCFLCFFVIHPRNVFWWVRIHFNHILSERDARSHSVENSVGNLRLFLYKMRYLLKKFIQ